MTLLEILVRELPKCGGWPDGVRTLEQYGSGFVYDSRTSYTSDHPFEIADFWGASLVSHEQYEAALVASKTAWDGEGLPPLNAEVEFIMEGAITPKWNRCKVMGYSEFGIAIQPYQGEFSEHTVWWAIPGKGESVRFRPVRSEADRKRDEILAALEACLVAAYADDSERNTEHHLYDAIAAGKIPHLKIV